MLKKAVILCTVAILVCCLWRGILIYKSYRDSENSKVKYIEYTIEEVDYYEKKFYIIYNSM